MVTRASAICDGVRCREEIVLPALCAGCMTQLFAESDSDAAKWGVTSGNTRFKAPVPRQALRFPKGVLGRSPKVDQRTRFGLRLRTIMSDTALCADLGEFAVQVVVFGGDEAFQPAQTLL